MTMKDDDIEETTGEEDHPLFEEDEPLSAEQFDSNSTEFETRKAEREDRLLENEHKRNMQLLEFNSVFKLLGWCIFLELVVFGLSYWKSTSITSSFFDLLKTIIVAVIGYLLGQKPKSRD